MQLTFQIVIDFFFFVVASRESSVSIQTGIADSSSVVDSANDTPPVLTASGTIDDVHPSPSVSNPPVPIHPALPSKVLD